MGLYSKLSEAELTTLLIAGDHAAFTEIYDRYWKKMFALAYQKLEDPEESQEIVQQIFIRLWDRHQELDIRSSLSGYIAVSVKYRIINALDKKHVRKMHLDSLSFDKAIDSTTELLEFEELRHRIESIVNGLPEKCRLVFKMSREDGLSQKEIAEKLDIAEKTVESHLGKAIKTLRIRLKPFLLTLL
jgi:RNA polymerase sigma-70 factor (family 1)